MKAFEDLGLKKPTILLPKKGTDYAKWSVIACDQYTSEPDYWKRVENTVGEAPSTLNLIFPEVYLDKGRDEEFITKINASMKKYEEEGILEPFEGFIVIDRKTPSINSRKGIIVALDLEHYDFNAGSQSLIRPTECTIAARLPPRMRVREKANVELPHILVLIDDPEKKVIEPLFEKNLEVAYEFDLMENGGSIKGYKVVDDKAMDEIAAALAPLADAGKFKEQYPDAPHGSKPLLFAMGDGNHSFATAKSCWEDLKKSGAPMDHPARYALVELQNIHDEGNVFEPIHRLLFQCDVDDLLTQFEKRVTEKGMTYKFEAQSEGENSPSNVRSPSSKRVKEAVQRIEFRSKAKNGLITIEKSPFVLAAGTLTDFVDQYLKEHDKTAVDYVHGEEVIEKECKNDFTAAFILPTIEKSELYKTVIYDGVLPRKTFSMGHADDKRFYLEARRIVPFAEEAKPQSVLQGS